MVERLRLVLLQEFGPQFDQHYVKLRENLPSRAAKSQILLMLLELACFQLSNIKNIGQESLLSITNFSATDLSFLRTDPQLSEAFK
mmetsp:Transcript_33196/g.50872  ORF Transcript_33196/g.50872 Transcript_33196/m.50872 type:complete len:86 (-) Transcript_33196:674-931(-)